MRRVVIIETQLKQYRRRFLLELAAKLRAIDIELKVAYSDPSPRELEQVGLEIDSTTTSASRSLACGCSTSGSWSSAYGTRCGCADLVVIEQGNKPVFNLVLLALSRLRLKRVAYWGHGYNHQATQPTVSEWLKRKLVTRVDWWFAYTDGVARYLVEHGVPARRITTVRNTIDTDELSESTRALSSATLDETRQALGIGATSPVGLFCGALTRASGSTSCSMRVA